MISSTGKVAHNDFFSQIGTLHSLSLGYQTIPSALLIKLLLYTPALRELALDVELDSYPPSLRPSLRVCKDSTI